MNKKTTPPKKSQSPKSLKPSAPPSVQPAAKIEPQAKPSRLPKQTAKPAVKQASKAAPKVPIAQPESTTIAPAPAPASGPDAALLSNIIGTFKNVVVVTDRQSMGATAHVEMRFRNVLEWLRAEQLQRTVLPARISLPHRKANAPEVTPHVIHIPDIRRGSLEHMAFSLFVHYRALGRSRPNIFIYHAETAVVADPVLLLTDYGNVLLGPNDGSLSMLMEYLKVRGVAANLFALDAEKVLELEQLRMESPEYQIPDGFPARDVYAVAAGVLAAGVLPQEILQSLRPVSLKMLPFAKAVQELSPQLHKKITAHAFPIATQGRLVTNLTADVLSAEQWQEEGATFRVTLPRQRGGFFQQDKQVITAVFGSYTGDNRAHFRLTSSLATEWDQRFIALHLPETLALPPAAVYEFTLERVQ